MHTVAVIAHDAAGNPGTLVSHRVIVAPVVLDGPPPAGRYDRARDRYFNPDANPAAAAPNGTNAGPAKVTLAFATRTTVRTRGRVRRVTRLTRRRTIGYHHSARMRARVTTPDGAPIAGARVYRATAVTGGAWKLHPKALMTSKTGRVSFVMPARSPSRRVQIVYFPTTASNDSSRSPARRLAVRAPVSLSIDRRSLPVGGRVTLTARLQTAIRRGTSILGVVQLRVSGRWRPIRQLRFTAHRHGAATTILRLRSAATHRLRVRVPAQQGLRYTTGVSRIRVVRVR